MYRFVQVYSSSLTVYLWEVKMTVRPSFTRLVITFHKNRRAFGSIPVVGSS